MPSSRCLRSPLLFVTLVLALIGTAGAQTEACMGLTIAVTDSSGGAVEGAIVVLYMRTTERRATTGVDGTARFGQVAAGEWTAEVRKEGFAITEQSVSVGTSPLRVE